MICMKVRPPNAGSTVPKPRKQRSKSRRHDTVPVKSHDVLVVGRSLVGCTAALAAAGTDRKVALLGPETDSGGPDYALAASSMEWLQQLGIDLKDAGRVARMRVFGLDGREMSFHAVASGRSELCHIVPHRLLSDEVNRKISESHGITCLNARLHSLECGEKTCVAVADDGTRIKAKLTIGADGSNSKTASEAGFAGKAESYGHSSATFRVMMRRDVQRTAWQWLGRCDVIALLPVSSFEYSVVWSLPTDLAGKMHGQSPAELAHDLGERTSGMAGDFEVASPVKIHPLSRLWRYRTVSNRIVLAGDSSHVLHPLAGMGLNLGLGDCRQLARTCLRLSDPGDSAALSRYELQRRIRTAGLSCVVGSVATHITGDCKTLGSAMERFALAGAYHFPFLKGICVELANAP